jgi:dethiobiotin synthetase
MSIARAARGCFVAGSDTEVGKTAVSAALLHLLGADGSRTAGCKPVAAGTVIHDGVCFNEDVRALRDASSLELRDAEVGPCQLAAACAPHIAAEAEGRSIDREALRRAVAALAQRVEWLVVEGVGGFRVPLGKDWDAADLACDLGRWCSSSACAWAA